MAEIDWTIVGPLTTQLLMQLVIAERERSGLTTEEIFEQAGRKLEENEVRLLADLERLKDV